MTPGGSRLRTKAEDGCRQVPGVPGSHDAGVLVIADNGLVTVTTGRMMPGA
jgi:hypothetical protein